DKLRSAPVPVEKTGTSPPPEPTLPPRPVMREEARLPSGCTAGDDRTIRNIANSFSFLWSQADAEHLAGLFTKMGDIRHPDGSIERGREVIQANRAQLFQQRDYQNSKHPLMLNDIRCLGSDVALADGKWELRLQEEPQSKPGRGLGAVKSNTGWCSLILVK